ncbi:hypothetical protein LCL97_23125 [Seohaeicola saemankumensis]|nr:hypothetical protein [Seohaeicola saemankumensis]MCA0873735.1 hypothetical protein [Seohaeicola saemankumensis]
MTRCLPAIALIALMAWHSPASAASTDVADPVVARIEAEGFEVSNVRRTWLGRIVITAQDGRSLREVVLNRTTGAVLRDELFPLPEGARPAAPDTDDQDDEAASTPGGIGVGVGVGVGGGIGGGVGGVGGGIGGVSE